MWFAVGIQSEREIQLLVDDGIKAVGS